jgi:uncharacterized membrane protein (TIGR02234 family)
MKGLRLAVLLALAGSGAVLVAAGQSWVRFRLPDTLAVGLPSLHERGRTLVPGAAALGWLGLASAVALVAVRGRVRVVVGAVVLASGIAVAVLDARWLAGGSDELRATEPSWSARAAQGERLLAWPVVSLVGGVLLGAAGGLAALRGRAWQGLGSSYEAPVARPVETVTDKGVWDALDRGDDPTA